MHNNRTMKIDIEIALLAKKIEKEISLAIHMFDLE